jgi:hypothetical protein
MAVMVVPGVGLVSVPGLTRGGGVMVVAVFVISTLTVVMRALMHGFAFRRQIALRIGFESLAAAGGAEIIGVAVIVGPMLGRPGIDIHAADRILGESERRRRRMGVVVVGLMCVDMSRVIVAMAFGAIDVPVGLMLVIVHGSGASACLFRLTPKGYPCD